MPLAEFAKYNNTITTSRCVCVCVCINHYSRLNHAPVCSAPLGHSTARQAPEQTTRQTTIHQQRSRRADPAVRERTVLRRRLERLHPIRRHHRCDRHVRLPAPDEARLPEAHRAAHRRDRVAAEELHDRGFVVAG